MEAVTMKPRAKAVAELETRGYQFKRHGANHDIYYNPEIGCPGLQPYKEAAMKYI